MNHYERLKVTQDAPPEVIRAAYRALANRLHPDRNGPGVGGDTHEQMAALNAAYEVLIDPALRRDYDDSLSTAKTWVAPHDDALTGDRDPAAGIVPSDLKAPVTIWGPQLKHILAAGGAALVLLTLGIFWFLRAELPSASVDASISKQIADPVEAARALAARSAADALTATSRGNPGRRPSVEELSRMSDEELLAAMPALDAQDEARAVSRQVGRPHPLDGPSLSLKFDQELLGSYAGRSSAGKR